jgi:predicted nucleic acid-binding protein
MGRLAEALEGYTVVGLDTSIFIYHFEANPAYLPLTRELLEGIETGRWRGVTTVITVMELAVRPFQAGQDVVARKYEALLAHFPNLSLVDIDRDIARGAAQLRAEFRLRPADALQAAGCLVAGAEVFVTNDRRLSRLEERLRVVVMQDEVRHI